MKKGIIIGAVCVLVLLVGLVVYTYTNNQEKAYEAELKLNVQQLLNSEDYTSVFNMYATEKEKYFGIINTEIEAYVNILCVEAVDSLSLDRITRFRDAGGNYVVINDTITQVESRLTELEVSSEVFKDSVIAYLNRDFDAAREGLSAVDSEDSHYQKAQEYLADLDLREYSWDNNITGRNLFYNSCAFDGSYLYVPFVLNGVDGIYKLTADGSAVDFFPLSDEEGTLVINGINVVGEYIYFIAGENVGSGYTFKNPYSIYEMKTDGTNLSLVLEGNFTDLFIKNDKAYAVSRESGLVEYDRYFEESLIINDGIVSEFSMADDGLYYTVQADLTYTNDNTVYFYNGQDSIEVDTDEYMHYYQFGDVHLKQWQQDPTFERLYYGKNEDEIRVRNADIYKVYGFMNGRVIYSCNGTDGRETIYAYQLDNGQTYQLVGTLDVIEYRIKGMFYEQNKVLIEENGHLYFADTSLANRQEIVNIQASDERLENNKDVINHLSDSDIYINPDEEKVISVIYDKQIWHYKDDKLHVVIEKRYMDEFDCNVYVSHIFTTDYSLLTTGNAKDSLTSAKTYTASEISNKYQTVFAQSTDTFLHEKNVTEGIIVRHGQVVRNVFSEDMFVLFEDGSADIYRYGDDIDADKLMELGAVTSFSFGPILVDDYKFQSDCARVGLSGRNPRSAIGYVEPGHYVLVASDGRDYEVSRGLTMVQLARIFEDEGCKLGYNLDGGMTTAVLFMGNYVTHRPAYGTSEWFFYRKIAEIFYVGTHEASPLDLTMYTCDYKYFDEIYK